MKIGFKKNFFEMNNTKRFFLLDLNVSIFFSANVITSIDKSHLLRPEMAGMETAKIKKAAYVRILEQPASKGLRFRYECEGRCWEDFVVTFVVKVCSFLDRQEASLARAAHKTTRPSPPSR